jgi:23S rRNA (guanosine2251-2'-O)-methyltransferase
VADMGAAKREDAVELVFGLHAVRHALDQSPASALEILVQQGRQQAAPVRRILESTAAAAVPVRIVSRQQLDSDSGYGRHQGLALLRRQQERPAADLESVLARSRSGSGLFLVLDGVQDPHNLGACVRTADAAAADAVVIPKDRAAPMTAAARKAASGGAEHTPVIPVTNLARALARMKEAGIWIVGTAAEAETSLYELDLRVPIALVLGGEGGGLRPLVRKHCDFLGRLPMRGAVESLNVSVAAGVCLYEALRQRGHGAASGPGEPGKQG